MLEVELCHVGIRISAVTIQAVEFPITVALTQHTRL